MAAKTIKEYIKYRLLNPRSHVKWPQKEMGQFKASKEGVLLICDFLERNWLMKDDRLTYKAGYPPDLKLAATFVVFSDALSCYMSAIHLGWNGHTTASAMLIRHIFESLVDLGFMFNKDTKRRLQRFVNISDVARYERLRVLHPNLSPKQFAQTLKIRYGKEFNHIKSQYLRHRRKFGQIKRTIINGKVKYIYRFFNDWTYGLLKKGKRVSIKQRVGEVNLASLHYSLGYSMLCMKAHPNAWELAFKAKVPGGAGNRINYYVLPDKDTGFSTILYIGAQYLLALFIIFARAFNLTANPGDKIVQHTDKIKDNEDFKDFFKKVKIAPNISF